MHPFPPAAELQFLIGDEILQVRLDPWSLQFMFASKSGITAEGCVEHIDKTGNSHRHQDSDVRTGEAIYLHQLIQRPVTGIEVEPFCLSMTFEGGAILRIYSDEGPYECGQIYPANLPPIIF